MPHIDRHTGCEVISTLEFFAHEDDRAGDKTTFDIAKQELLTALTLDLQVVEHTA